MLWCDLQNIAATKLHQFLHHGIFLLWCYRTALNIHVFKCSVRVVPCLGFLCENFFNVCDSDFSGSFWATEQQSKYHKYATSSIFILINLQRGCTHMHSVTVTDGSQGQLGNLTAQTHHAQCQKHAHTETFCAMRHFLRSNGCLFGIFTVSENSSSWHFLQFRRILRIWHLLLFQRIPLKQHCMQTYCCLKRLTNNLVWVRQTH